MTETLKYYLDENIEIAVADQLKRRNIDVITALELNLLGASDENHLQRAVSMQRVLCTYDFDFVVMASAGVEHCGIVMGINQATQIGDWMRFLGDLHRKISPSEMLNIVRYVSKG